MAKAFCAHGGLAVGTSETIARLWQSFAARGAVSGTSMGAAMTAASLRHIRAHPERLDKLRANTQALKAMIEGLGFRPARNISPVAAFEHGSALDMERIQKTLWEEGIFVIHSRYLGSGPDGTLRLAAFADHETADFERLEAALSALL